MPETRRNREIALQRIAQKVTRRLTFWITALILAAAILIFRIGEDLWPMWLIEYRIRIAALLFLITIGSLLLSPLIIEYSKHPRAFSGPGKNPYIDP